jgi:hypothetical protein
VENGESNIEADLVLTDPEHPIRHSEAHRTPVGDHRATGRICQVPRPVPVDTDGDHPMPDRPQCFENGNGR